MMTRLRDGQHAAPPNDRCLVRPATKSDLPAIQDVARAAYALYVPRIGREPAPMRADFVSQVGAGQIHVAIQGNHILGYIVLYARDDHIHVENMAVGPAFQGQGIGRILLAFADRFADDKGLHAVELYTNEKMTENLAIYPRLGYHEIDRRTEDGFDRVYFRKDLG